MDGVAGVMFSSPLKDEEISEELMERVGTAGPLKRRGGIKTFKNMNDINPEAVRRGLCRGWNPGPDIYYLGEFPI